METQISPPTPPTQPVKNKLVENFKIIIIFSCINIFLICLLFILNKFFRNNAGFDWKFALVFIGIGFIAALIPTSIAMSSSKKITKIIFIILFYILYFLFSYAMANSFLCC